MLRKARSQTQLLCPVPSPTMTRYLKLKFTSALLLTTSTNLLSTSAPNIGPVSRAPAAPSKCAANLPSPSQSLFSKTTLYGTSQPDHTLVCHRPTVSSSEWLAGPTGKKRDAKARPKSSPPKTSGLTGSGREGSPGQRMVTGWLEGKKGKGGDGEMAFV